jgi:energy-coupling factor transporter ATP-binding protein EcfA2
VDVNRTLEHVDSGRSWLNGLSRRCFQFFAEAEAIAALQDVPEQMRPRTPETNVRMLDGPAKSEVKTHGFAPEQVGLLAGLKRLLTQEAIIVLGPKGSGKTTLSLALLYAVVAEGHNITIIDPHAELNRWPANVRCYGRGLDYAEIDRTLLALFAEMKLRYQKGQEGRREPLYAFIDEVPSIREECPSWSKVFAKLLREARKVNIHVVVLSQSFLVEDLGINGDTRTNLTVVALGKAVSRYLSRATHINEREKQALIEATRGRTWPAIIDSGDVPVLFVVDRANEVITHVEPRIWDFDSTATSKPGNDELLLLGLLEQTSPKEKISALGRLQTAETSLDYPSEVAGDPIGMPQTGFQTTEAADRPVWTTDEAALPQDDTSKMIRALLLAGYSKNKIANLVSPTSKGKGYELIKLALGE